MVGKAFKANGGVSFQRIKVGKLSKKYLFFDLKLNRKDAWQVANATLRLEKINQTVGVCKIDGTDSCYIPTTFLKPESVVLISIICEDDCSYSVNTRESDLEHMIPGEQYMFVFGEENDQLYHVELGSEKDFEEFRVIIHPRASKNIFTHIKMYGKWGGDSSPTEKDHDFKSVNLWEDGEGIFLSKKDMREKSFNIFITGSPDTTFQLSS